MTAWVDVPGRSPGTQQAHDAATEAVGDQRGTAEAAAILEARNGGALRHRLRDLDAILAAEALRRAGAA